MRWQTKQYHKENLSLSRPYFIKQGLNEITEGVFRDEKRCVDFYPSKRCCYYYKEKKYFYHYSEEELIKSGFDKKTAHKLATGYF